MLPLTKHQMQKRPRNIHQESQGEEAKATPRSRRTMFELHLEAEELNKIMPSSVQAKATQDCCGVASLNYD